MEVNSSHGPAVLSPAHIQPKAGWAAEPVSTFQEIRKHSLPRILTVVLPARHLLAKPAEIHRPLVHTFSVLAGAGPTANLLSTKHTTPPSQHRL